jgi:2-methylcitrate dehydratase PrpD
VELDTAYRTAFLDWLACAVGGWKEPAAAAARAADPGLLGRVMALGTAGHVLDFDDTYAPGLVHCSAPVAPAALVLGAESNASMGDVLVAYARGWEATAALARPSHPELYRRGWHPTAVCGVVGAAVASAAILGLDDARTDAAINLSLLQAAGLRAAFGSDGKALQVGMAAAAGARAAQLGEAGASAPDDVRGGFEQAYGVTWSLSDPSAEVITSADDSPAIKGNWIKAYPCCLQTHSAIEAAELVRREGGTAQGAIVDVNPISLQAAPIEIPADPLQAKFSIPYTVAFTRLYGPPGISDFRALDDGALRLAKEIAVETNPGLGESEVLIETGDVLPIRVQAALGSPQRPMDEAALAGKVQALAGDLLEGALAPDRPALEVLRLLERIADDGSQTVASAAQ